MKQILILSNNPVVITAFKEELSKIGVDALAAIDRDPSYQMIIGRGATRVTIAKAAEIAAAHFNMPVIADVVTYEIEALRNWPHEETPFLVADLPPHALETELTNKIKPNMGRKTKKNIYLAIALPNKKAKIIITTQPGSLALKPRGEAGAGFDRIFMPRGARQTIAQLIGENAKTFDVYRHAVVDNADIISELLK